MLLTYIWWHHWLDGHEFEQAQGVGDGQGSLVCCSPWGRKESDKTERLNNEMRLLNEWGMTRGVRAEGSVFNHAAATGQGAGQWETKAETLGSVPMLPLPVLGSTLLHIHIFQDSQSFQVWPWTAYARSTCSHLTQVMIMGGSENRVTDAGSRARSTLGFVVPSRPDRSLLLRPTKPSLRAAAPGPGPPGGSGPGSLTDRGSGWEPSQ